MPKRRRLLLYNMLMRLTKSRRLTNLCESCIAESKKCKS